MFNGAQPGRPGRARPTWSRWLLLVLSIVTLLMTTAAPADAGGAGSSPDITSAPVSPTTATPLTWAFTSSAAATSCELVRGTTVVSALATCVSGAPSATFDVSADPGGSYTFTVYDADAADVNGTTPSDTSTVDVAPVAPTVSRTTASPGSSRSPEWTFDTPTGATDACELDDPDGNAVDTESPCTSPYDADLTGDDDGTYTLSVTATSGGVTGAAGSSSYLLDTTPPPAPSVTAPSGPGSNFSPSFTVSDTESGVSFQCSVGGPSTVPAPTCGPTTTLDLTRADEGTYTLSVTATDPAGNVSGVSTATYTLDVPPAPVVVAPASPGRTKNPQFTISDADPTAILTCHLISALGHTIFTGHCPANGTFATSGFSDGTYTLVVTATDTSGHSTSTTIHWTRDTTAPPEPSVTPPASPGNSVSPAFTVSDSEAGVTYTCSTTPTEPVLTCGTTTTLDLSAATDGTYSVSVSAVDAAGNVSAARTASYLLDTTPPSPPEVSAPASPANSRSPSFTVTDADPTASFTCSVSPSPATVTSCGATTGVSLSGAPDGVYTLSVTATDAAGNTSAAGSASYTLDTTAPPVPSVVAPPSPAQSLSPSFLVSDTEAGVTFTCTTTPSVPLSACGGSVTLDLSGSPDGVYTLSVTATDAAGNTSAAGSASYILDTTPPPAPVVSAPASPSNLRTPAFSVTDAESGVAFACSVLPSVTITTCGATSTLNLTGAPDGVYTLSVTATDSAGNTSAAGTATYTLDTTPPATPLVSAPQSPSNVTAPVFAVTEPGSDPSVTLSCAVTGPGPATVTTCGPSTSLNLSSGPDGTYVLTVTATDGAGNTASASANYVLDTTPPPVPVVTVAAIGNSRSPVFTVTDRQHTVTLACTVTPAVPITCGSSTTLDLTGAADGSYTVSVTATDIAGNTSRAGTASYLLDTVPPTVPVVTLPVTGHTTSPAFTIVEPDAGVSLTCFVTAPDSSVIPLTTCPPSGSFGTGSHSDGLYTMSVTATDAAGNASTGQATYLLDRVPPAAPAISPASSIGNSRSPVFTVTPSEANVTLSCSVVPEVPVSCGDTTTLNLTGQADLTYTLSVVETDAAGNVGSAGTATYLLDTVPPAEPGVSLLTYFRSSNPDPQWEWRPGGSVAEQYPLTATCVLTDPSGQASVLSACPENAAFATPLGGGEGVYRLSVTVTDEAGNISPAGTATYDYDKSASFAPVVYLHRPAIGVGNSRHPVWSVKAAALATLTCQLFRGGADGLAESASATCAGPRVTYSLKGMADGTYTLVVTSVEPGDPTPVSVPSSYLLDTTPPAAPTLLTGTGSPSADETPEWTFQLPPDAVTGRCVWVRGSTRLFVQNHCTNETTYSLAGLPDGPVIVKVYAYDEAGNRSRPLVISYVLDRVPPARPTVHPPTTESPDAVWGISGNPDDVYVCTLLAGDRVVVSARLCGGHPAYQMASMPTGIYTLTVTQRDAAGVRSAPGSAEWFWLNQAGGGPTTTGPGHHGSGHPGSHHGSGGTTVVTRLPGIVQHVIHRLGKDLTHPSATVHHALRVVPPAPDEVSHAVQSAVSAVGQAGGGTGFPLILIGLVVVFLVVQNRIDRRDPKLAFASVAADDLVEFEPPPSREDGE
jgi:hypothetical protein